MSDELEAAAARLRQAVEMHDLGVEMMRARLRREDPSLSEERLSARIAAWLQTRPGAEHGDADGAKGTREVERGWPQD